MGQRNANRRILVFPTGQCANPDKKFQSPVSVIVVRDLHQNRRRAALDPRCKCPVTAHRAGKVISLERPTLQIGHPRASTGRRMLRVVKQRPQIHRVEHLAIAASGQRQFAHLSISEARARAGCGPVHIIKGTHRRRHALPNQLPRLRVSLHNHGLLLTNIGSRRRLRSHPKKNPYKNPNPPHRLPTNKSFLVLFLEKGLLAFPLRPQIHQPNPPVQRQSHPLPRRRQRLRGSHRLQPRSRNPTILFQISHHRLRTAAGQIPVGDR